MTEVKFEEDFLLKTLALYIRDRAFCERTDGLIKPDFFETEYDKYIFTLATNHFKKYDTNPSPVSLSTQFKEDEANNLVRKDVVPFIKSRFQQLYKTDISDRDFIVEKVAEFMRKQATVQAVLKSAELLQNNGDINTILPMMQKAIDVGASDLNQSYDYKDAIAQRSDIRKARLKGEIAWNSVSTGYRDFDNILYKKGWGKGELALYMGPAKSGKSVALLEHALRAVERGFNTLFVSLEVSTEIQADRMDSNISGVRMKDLYVHIDKVDDRVKRWTAKAATFKMHEYPSGTFRVSDLRRLIKKYQAVGTTFDFVVLDYADIMLSESSSQEGVDKSKQVMIDLRALAQMENVAILSATQTNRSGANVGDEDVIRDIHVAEDYNKIRIADLVISINANANERQANEARLYFAASRNQEPVTITVKRDMAVMKHIKEIIGVV